MNIQELKKLAKALSTKEKNKSYEFSLEEINPETQETISKVVKFNEQEMNETLRTELFELCGSHYGYEANKNTLFQLISETVDIILPRAVEKFFEGYMTVKTIGANDIPEITLNNARKNRKRAKTFVTKVSSAGVYEVFRLAKAGKFTLEVNAFGSAAQLQFEEFMKDSVDWQEMMEIIEEGFEDVIYSEILKAFDKVRKSLPTKNFATTDNFDNVALEKVLSTISAYGPATIFCTETFARTITEGSDWASEDEKKARRNVGYLANYKNAKIVILPQSFEDETNTVELVDNSIGLILPAGRGDIFQVIMQGDTYIKDVDNSDWSKEIQTYKRLGVAVIAYNDIGYYEITSLANK